MGGGLATINILGRWASHNLDKSTQRAHLPLRIKAARMSRQCVHVSGSRGAKPVIVVAQRSSLLRRTNGKSNYFSRESRLGIDRPRLVRTTHLLDRAITEPSIHPLTMHAPTDDTFSVAVERRMCLAVGRRHAPWSGGSTARAWSGGTASSVNDTASSVDSTASSVDGTAISCRQPRPLVCLAATCPTQPNRGRGD